MLKISRIRKMTIYPCWSALLPVLLGLAFGGCKPPAPAAKKAEQNAPARTSRVDYVIDGDTLILDSREKVRFLGINTPEIRKSHGGLMQGVEQPWGRDAANYLKRLLTGRKVSLEFDGERTGKFGRLLAYVILDGGNVNLRLVRLGYARFNDYGKKIKYDTEFRQAESRARVRNLGLWDGKGRFKAPEYYLAGKEGEYFHKAGCPRLQAIPAHDRFRVTGEEALKMGLKPGPACLGKEEAEDDDRS
jgi:micrococcal nuclease